MQLTPEQQQLALDQQRTAAQLFKLLQIKLKPYEDHLGFKVEHLTLQTAVGFSAFICMNYLHAIAEKMIQASQEAANDPSANSPKERE